MDNKTTVTRACALDTARPLPGRLPHAQPSWVRSDALHFITLCALPRGANTLCRRPVAENLWTSVRHYAELGKWSPALLLLMPDHLHALMTFGENQSSVRTLTAWKRYTARAFGVTWQESFFEHRLRHDESWRAKSAYIEMNPVRAGLVASADEWPYLWRLGLPEG